jgi:hypothetical protein
MAPEGSGDVFAGEYMDLPLIEDWSGPGRYRAVILPARRFLEAVVRRGPEADAARAGAMLLAAGGLPASTRAAIAARFPPRRGGIAGGGE